jgi:hypothetical protein
MIEEGKYFYCIIGSKEGRNFGPIGMGDRGKVVYTIGYQDLSGVVSDSPMSKYVINKENLTTHERVIEEVMKDYTALPVRFCTMATSAEEIRNLLRKRYVEFKNLLRDMDHKVELGVKALWKDMNVIFQEIVTENKGIKRLKEKLTAYPSRASDADKIALGEMVQSALQTKKKAEGEKILALLKKASVDCRSNKVHGDHIILNAAFLVDKSREKEFDYLVDELTEKNRQRIAIKYIGPAPPFNFVNIVVEWTERR